MFNYDGDIEASLDDFEDLLAQVIHETFPTAKCTVRIRQTKAMPEPKISISMIDGPMLDDLIDAVPLLAGAGSNTGWAYCGKVIPNLGYWIRDNPKSTLPEFAKIVWTEMRCEAQRLGTFDATWGGRNHVCIDMGKQRLTQWMRRRFPPQPSATMALITRGTVDNIAQIATEQRRDDLAVATPLAGDANAVPPQHNRGRL